METATMTPETFKRRVEERLRALEWTQADLARKAGVKPSAVKDIFRERFSYPRGDNLLLIANALGCSANYLVGLTDDENPNLPPRIVLSADVLVVTKANAGASFADGEEAAVALSFETTTSGEVGLLLPDREALWLRERIDDAIRDLAVEEKRRQSSLSHPSSA